MKREFSSEEDKTAKRPSSLRLHEGVKVCNNPRNGQQQFEISKQRHIEQADTP
jgi:hypothetical protein